MSQDNLIDVEIHPIGTEPGVDGEEAALYFEDVNYISFVSSPGGNSGGTYGIPALISEDRVKAAGLPVKILYVNPANIAAMLARRTQ